MTHRRSDVQVPEPGSRSSASPAAFPAASTDAPPAACAGASASASATDTPACAEASPASRSPQPVCPPTPDHGGSSIPETILGWGLFCRLIAARAGTLFCLAAVICFFAYNWDGMSAFAKFGLLGGGMAAACVFALWRGLHSLSGGLALLACGLLAGALLAVYGQVYQTGADAWELFRAWSLFLLPLALAGRKAGLWFALWLVASLWALLYVMQDATVAELLEGDEPCLLLIFCAQVLFLAAWEAARRRFLALARPFPQALWFPRVVGFVLVILLAMVVSGHILSGGYALYALQPTAKYVLLYLAFIAAGGWWYTRVRRDLVPIAAGLLSLLSITLTLLIRLDPDFPSVGGLLLTVLVVLAFGAAAARLLLFLHRTAGTRPSHREAEGAHPHNLPQDEGRSELRLALRGPTTQPARQLATQVATHAPQRVDRPSARQQAHQPERTADSDALILAPSIPGAAPSPGITPSPWTARLLPGLCAWIAVPFSIGLLLLVFYDVLSNFDHLTPLFLSLLGVGLLLSGAQGMFVRQVSLCLCLSGAVAASVLIPIAHSLDFLCLLPAIGIFAVSGTLSRSGAYRVMALTLAIVLTFMQADTLAVMAGVKFTFAEEAVVTAHSVLFYFCQVFFALFAALLSVALVRNWEGVYRPGRKRDILLAGFSGLCLLGTLALLARQESLLGNTFHALLRAYLYYIGMVGVGASLGLLAFVRQRLRELALPAGVTTGGVAFCLIIAAISYRLPWLGTGLLALALSRQAGSLPLLGTAIIFLAGWTVGEYYALTSTLLSKSYSLMGVGLACLILAGVVHRGLAKTARSGFLAKSARPGFPAMARPENRRPAGADDPCVNGPETCGPTRSALPARDRPEYLPLSQPTARHCDRDALRQGLAAVSLLLFLGFFVWSVQAKEGLLSDGQPVLLALRPVDPRSLMQGDYMILNLELEQQIASALRQNGLDTPSRGIALIRADSEGVYSFSGLAGEKKETLPVGTLRIAYRGARNKVQVGSGSFFFQEGYGKAYEAARFAEVRVGVDGTVLIRDLRDQDRRPIRPGRESEEE